MLNVNPNPLSHTCQLNSNSNFSHHGVDGQSCGHESSKRGQAHTLSPRLSFEGVTTAPAPTVQPDEKTASKSRAASSLGSIANSSTNTGRTREAREETEKPPVWNQLDRYADLLRDNPKHRYIDGQFTLMQTARRLLIGTDEKILDCSRLVAPTFDRLPRVEVVYNPERESVSYRGLVRCENRSCPVCGFVLADETRRKLSVTLGAAKDEGIYAYLVTITLSHQKTDSLAYTRGLLAESWKRFTSGGAYTRWADDNLIIGYCRTTEEPYGKNGWHPHMHILIFSHLELVGLSLAQFERGMQKRWAYCVRQEGGNAALDVGLKVDIANSAIADYISKYGREPASLSWGADSEMSHGNLKQSSSPDAKKVSFTPTELLKVAAPAPSDTQEDFMRFFGLGLDASRKMAGALWKEHYWAVKGKPRVYFSPNLRKFLDIDRRITEFEEAQNAMEEAKKVVLADVTICYWHSRIMMHHALNSDLRAELLVNVKQSIVDHSRADLDDFVSVYGLNGGVSFTPDFLQMVAPNDEQLPIDPHESEKLRPAIFPASPPISPLSTSTNQLGFEGLDSFNVARAFD